jgi:hypothetical protein
VLFVWLCGLYLRLVGLDVLVLVSLVLVLAIGLMVGALAFYHVQLVALNLTTNEHHNFWRYEYFKVSGLGVPCHVCTMAQASRG